MGKIFVGGLSPEVLEMDIVMLVSIYAQVVTVKIVRDKVTHKSKGYAFLEMVSQADAEKAASDLNGISFKGNTLTVKVAEETPVKSSSHNKAPKIVVKNKRPRLKP